MSGKTYYMPVRINTAFRQRIEKIGREHRLIKAGGEVNMALTIRLLLENILLQAETSNDFRLV